MYKNLNKKKFCRKHCFCGANVVAGLLGKRLVIKEKETDRQSVPGFIYGDVCLTVNLPKCDFQILFKRYFLEKVANFKISDF